ncbi:hypothetical protein K523DRAFT_406716 [Schizophyllum commune Tattone D]|nr:hypothetical protein K523DRAFT_406716 [Schizophyllum commune Tattone D]
MHNTIPRRLKIPHIPNTHVPGISITRTRSDYSPQHVNDVVLLDKHRPTCAHPGYPIRISSSPLVSSRFPAELHSLVRGSGHSLTPSN